MQNESPFRPAKEHLTCSICNRVFFHPITLSCGHTFCKTCIQEEKRKKEHEQESEEPRKNKNNKVPVCPKCESIIWRSVSDMNYNLTIQSLVQKYYPNELKEITRAFQSKEDPQGSNFEESGKFRNKILIKIESPAVIPMPFCYSEIYFTTSFVEDITNQSNELVVTWKELFQLNLGLLGSLQKIESAQNMSGFSKVIFETTSQTEVPQNKFKALIFGLAFVKITEVGAVTINLRNKFIVLGKQPSKQMLMNLEICDCEESHSRNFETVVPEDFHTFFKVYDLMNNPHYMQQIYSMISDRPFLTRNNPENMIYCAIKVLRMNEGLRKEIVMCFDDQQRMRMMNEWLSSKKESLIDEIINVKVPGKFNTGFVFFMVFLLFALNLFQDYNTAS